jgi:hypothetical protein
MAGSEEQWHLRPQNPNNPVVFFGEATVFAAVLLLLLPRLQAIGATNACTYPSWLATCVCNTSARQQGQHSSMRSVGRGIAAGTGQ